MRKFPYSQQLDAMDCGPACLQMIAKYYGKSLNLAHLRENCCLGRNGVSMLGISIAAETMGFRTLGVHLTFNRLFEATMPCIVHWRQKHFVVVYKIKRRPNGKCVVYVADPASGLIKYTQDEFNTCWLNAVSNGKQEGMALLLEPTPDFYAIEDEKLNKTKLTFILRYLRPYKKLIAQLFLGMLMGVVLQLIFPFLSQSIVDYGIGTGNISFVVVILIAQLTLYVAQTAVEFIRSWILLHISTRINVSIISDFLIKLMKLPISYFDTKMIGDLMQRIGDHSRIESFLTSTTLNTIFSFVSLVVFSIILAVYNLKLLLVFIIASFFYIVWITLFFKKRKEIDNKRFAQASAEQSNLYQLITGMQEIKLNNCENQKRWEWEHIQAKLFKISVKGLALGQYQQSGAFFINESKNIIISFVSALAVINGEMTLGMMTAVQYIIGQLNSPINQLIGFVQSAQDAKISLERLGEIHNKKDEDQDEADTVHSLPSSHSITMENLSFSYDALSSPVLDNINLHIPEGKTTAIVGMSGSGKTTLIKLLLGFYNPTQGSLNVGNVPLRSFDHRYWRECCGAVMQDGFIFSDTIARNIAVGQESIDTEKLIRAMRIANIEDMVYSLPLGVNTLIGQDGKGLSQGQKQRILIARAVYKDPEFLYFDEATNSLDANNELVIMGNLREFFEGKTVVIVAHRLSTVKSADQIIVLQRGQIVEQGNHEQLIAERGQYYQLVKNQLELGN
ncbi:MAG: peptidase domain-containing ABC transporter [Bacteroidales bacterium]|nr:peptidase domain-containing ABC transporter [Bacteroidales bacterium]MBQ7711962.1 peptidase domain-containing ABC transporter [Bacteroidales bacterium]